MTASCIVQVSKLRRSDDSELLQLPGVTRKREQRLRDYGFISLWDVAEADSSDLAEALIITRALAHQMITTAKYLVTIK